MSYEKICDSNKVEVLKHFIRVESTNCECAKRRKELMGWITLPGDDFINRDASVQEREKRQQSYLCIYNRRAAVTKLEGWVLAKINLGSLYTRGMYPDINCSSRIRKMLREI